MFEFGNNMHWLTSSKRLLYLRHQRFCYESLSLFLGCIVAYHRNICQIFSLLFIPPSLSLNSTNCVFINLQIIIYCSWFENYVNLYYQSHMCVLKFPPLVPINGMLIILWYGFFYFEEPSKPIWANSAWSHGRFYCHIPHVETAIPFPYGSSFTVHKSWSQNAMTFPCLLFRNLDLLTLWRCSKFF